MSRASVVALGQVAAEAGMVDACTIRRVTGRSTNPDTGVTTKTYLAPDPYVGKCRIQQPQAMARPHDVGEDFLLISRLEVQLPVAGTTGLLVGDEVTITAAARDPDLVGRLFVTHELPRKTDATSRRIQVIERTD
jgi:hypothetical protein